MVTWFPGHAQPLGTLPSLHPTLTSCGLTPHSEMAFQDPPAPHCGLRPTQGMALWTVRAPSSGHWGLRAKRRVSLLPWTQSEVGTALPGSLGSWPEGQNVLRQGLASGGLARSRPIW